MDRLDSFIFFYCFQLSGLAIETENMCDVDGWSVDGNDVKMWKDDILIVTNNFWQLELFFYFL